MSETTSRIRFIDRDKRRIEIETNNIIASYPLNAIPDALYQKIADSLDGPQEPEEKLRNLYISTAMKPTLSTLDHTNPFPINSATKIVRLTLTDDAILDQIDELESELLSLQGRPFQETITQRIELYQSLVLDDSKMDRFRFGAVEMFGDVTYTNIMRDPRASLGFFWVQDQQPTAVGFQINCIVEVVPPGNPFFRYMRVMRQLFSSQLIDLRKDDYVGAYKLWVSEYREKTLMSKPGFVPRASS
ncbi:MAG: hypothetical protein ACXAEB_10875 [Candidatus Thorarchaeota archaeon]|jgi:hypothetical protein